MQTIGERLEEARKRKGLSIREAAEATKIRGDYLQKFESNSFEVDLPPLYVRGFLRGYARHLGLDAERLVQDYDSLLVGQGKPARRETRESYGRMDVGGEAAGSSPAADRPDPSSSTNPPLRRPAIDQLMMIKYGVIAVTAIVVIVVVFGVVKLMTSGSSKDPASAPATAASTTSVANESLLTVTASGTVRVKVVVEDTGAVLLPDMPALNPGQSRVLRYSSQLLVTVEDATKVRIEVNGRLVDIPDGIVKAKYGRFRVPTRDQL